MTNLIVILVTWMLVLCAGVGFAQEVPASPEITHVDDAEPTRPKVDGPGFRYFVRAQFKVDSFDGSQRFGLKRGDELQLLSDGERSHVTERLTPDKFETLLAGPKGSKILVTLASREGSKTPPEEIFELERTEKRGDTYYPPISWTSQGQVLVSSVDPNSPAERKSEIKRGSRIEAAGTNPEALEPLEGPRAWQIAARTLNGERGTKFFVRIAGHADPIELHHFSHLEAELLPPPPPAFDKEKAVPAVEDDVGCHIRVEREIVAEVARIMDQTDIAKVDLDGALSVKFHERYFNQFDPSRVIFTAEDMQHFEKNRRTHDRDFREGNLKFAFDVHTRLLERLTEREQWTLEVLASPINANAKGVFVTGGSKSPLTSEAKKKWAKYIEREYLKLLAKKYTPEQAKTWIQERISRQRTRISNRCRGRIMAETLNVLGGCFGLYTKYLTPKTAIQLRGAIENSTCGLGIEIKTAEEHIIIEKVHADSPAARGGLKPGDEIVAIGAGPAEFLSIDAAGMERLVDKFPKKCDEEIFLQVRNRGNSASEPLRFKTAPFSSAVVKATGTLYEVPDKNGTLKVAHIVLPSFYGGIDTSAADDLAKLLKDYKEADSLVLDLRGNPGGLLREAVESAGLFLGNAPVVQVVGSNRTIEVHYPKSYTTAVTNVPLVVLVDENSASAAEILAAAIKDHRRGVVVGNRHTHGKAQVQTILPVSHSEGQATESHGATKVSDAAYYQATGKSPAGIGVTPNIHLPSVASRPEEERSEQAAVVDLQHLPSAIKTNAGKLNQVLLDQLNRQFEARAEKDPVLQAIRSLETVFNRAAAITAREYSLELFSRQMGLLADADALIEKQIPQGAGQFHKFPNTAYGTAVLRIAADITSMTKNIRSNATKRPGSQ